MIISDKLYLTVSNLGYKVNKLCELFTYRNPEYWARKKAKLSVNGIDKLLFHYNLRGDTLELPRGSLPKVKEFLKNNSIQERYLDQRIVTDPIDVTLVGTKVEDQQSKIINLLLENEGGLVEMSPAGGKTISVIALLAQLKQKSLILVHEFRLAKQWVDEIKQRLSGKYTLGRFDGTSKQVGDITVAIINSVAIRYQEDPKFLDQFGAVVVDECLDPETIIVTPKGLKKLGLLNVGDEVTTPKGTATIKKIWKRHKPAFQYITKLGYLIASEDHKVSTLKNVKKGIKGGTKIQKIGKCTHLIRSVVHGKPIFEPEAILEKRPLGQRTLIDIEIDSVDHLFIANGFVTQNCHHIPANMFSQVVNNTKAKYRIGVTGTTKRKDGKEIILYDIIGNPLTSIKSHQIKHRITDFDFKVVNTNIRMNIPMAMRWTGRERETVIDFTKCLSVLTEDKDRNSIIVQEAIEAINNGYVPMILSDRVKHNKELAECLKNIGYNTALLIGETRNKIKLEDIKGDESIQCIIANSKIASEGLDIPRLSAVILTCPSTNLPKLEQQIGRIRRHVAGKKKPLVIDICDNLAVANGDDGPVHLLQIMAKKRLKLYIKLQEEYRSVL